MKKQRIIPYVPKHDRSFYSLGSGRDNCECDECKKKEHCCHPYNYVVISKSDEPDYCKKCESYIYKTNKKL